MCGMRFKDLQCREVICVRDGQRLGFISDLELSVPDGRILAIVVPEPGKICSFCCGKEEFIIPWSCICRIGPDIVLVDIRPDDCRCPRKKAGNRF